MKKSLSLLVAIAMVFSMFAAVASAAPAEGQSAGEYLKEIGVIQGGDKGDLMEEEALKRQDAAILVARLVLGLEAAEDLVKNGEKTHTYTDVRGSYYDGVLSWAEAEGYMEGDVAGKTFGFDREVTIQEFATVIVRALGFTVGTTEDVDVQYADVVAKAVELGLLAEGTDGKAKAIRGDLYGVIVKGLDTEVKGTGKTLGNLLELPGYEVTEVAIANSSAVGAKKLEVKFNQPVDTTLAKFEVKRGSGKINLVENGIAFSDDKTTATLTLVNLLTVGEYTVSVTGLTEEALTTTITAADETVKEIQFLSDKAPVGTKVDGNPDYQAISVSYKVVNQYGEDVTSKYEDEINWSVSKGAANAGDGQLLVTTDSQFVIGELVVATGVYSDANGAASKTATLTVSAQSRVDSFEVAGLYHEDDKTPTTSSDFSEYYVLVKAFDQYGNSVTNVTKLNAETSRYTTNPTVFNVGDFVDGIGEENDQIGLQLAAPTSNLNVSGKNTVRVVTNFTGKTTTYDVEVGVGSELYSLSLSRPDAVVAAGDGTVKIPFTATDKNGNALTDLRAYADGGAKENQLSLSGGLSLEYDYVKGESYLEYTVPGTEQTTVLTALVAGSGKFSQVTIKVEEAAEPTSIGGVKDLIRNMVVGANQDIKQDYIVVYDQHGREITPDWANYDIIIKDDNKGFVTLDPTTEHTPGNDVYVIAGDDDVVNVVASVKGSETITVALAEEGEAEAIPGSAFTFRLNVLNKADVASYTADDVPTLYNNTSHAKELKVYGLRGNDKVVLPASMYTVAASHNIVYIGGKLDANASLDGADANTTQDAKVTIIIDAPNVNAIEKTVKVSNVEPKLASIHLDDQTDYDADGTVVKAKTNFTMAGLFTTLDLVDQYGVDTLAPDLNEFNVAVTNYGDLTVTGNGTSTADIDKVATPLAVGDTFNVTFTHKEEGVKITIRVVITA
jgi:Uncharacterized conserved protein